MSWRGFVEPEFSESEVEEEETPATDTVMEVKGLESSSEEEDEPTAEDLLSPKNGQLEGEACCSYCAEEDMDNLAEVLKAAKTRDMQNVAEALKAAREYYFMRASIPTVKISLENIKNASDHIPKIHIKNNVNYADA